VIRAPIGCKDVVGADGVMHSVPDRSGGEEIEELTLDVSALGHSACYGMRKGELLTADGGKLTIPMQAGDGYAIALLPYVVKGLTATQKVADRALTVEWSLAGSNGRLTTHVARVEVADAATGNVLRHFCANVVTSPDGKGSVSFPLALEEAGRTFKAEVRDVLSGLKVTAGQ